MDVGGRIKELREALGLTGVGLAKRAGIKQSTLYSIEAEGVQPTIPTLEAICQGLGVSLSDFFKENTLPGNEDMLVATYLGNQIASLPENRKKLIKELIEDWEKDSQNSNALVSPPLESKDKELSVAKRIRHARVEKGLTIPHFSDLTQIRESQLTKFEEGIETPSIKELNAILAALEISAFDFFQTQEPDSIEVRFEPLDTQLQEKIKQAIYEGGDISFTLKFEVVDVLKDGESVLPEEMKEPSIEEGTITCTADNDGVEGSVQYASPQYDANYTFDSTQSYVMEGKGAIDEPEPKRTKNKPRIGNNVETLAAHRSDDPMTDLPDEAWENVQELLNFHEREVEKERKDKKK